MAHKDQWYIDQMLATLEDYNECCRWEDRESAVVRDGHIKIATCTAARKSYDHSLPSATDKIETTEEVIVGVFGSTDELDIFLAADTRVKDQNGLHQLHRGPVQ